MKIIPMTASQDALTASVKTIGCANDHLSTVLRIALDADWQTDATAYRLAFQTADGYACMTELLHPVDGELSFALPNVLMVEGQLQVQLIAYADEVITHTPKSTSLTVLASIAPPTEIPHDYTGLIYPGVGIAGVSIEDGNLVVRYQDGTEQNAGQVTVDAPEMVLEHSEFWQSVTFPKTTVIRFEKGAQIVADNGVDISSSGNHPVLINGVWLSGSVGGTSGRVRRVLDPEEEDDAATKRYVDRAVSQSGTRWKPLVNATIDVDTDQTAMMFPLDISACEMQEFQTVIILPLKNGATASSFSVKAFLTDEDISASNTLLSRNAIAVSAGGRLLVDGGAVRVGDGMLRTIDSVYSGFNGSKTPYTALQYYDASLLKDTPHLRVTLTNGQRFEAGTQIILQGR